MRSRAALLVPWTPGASQQPPKRTPSPVHPHAAAASLASRQPVGIAGSLFRLQNSRPLFQTYGTRTCILIGSPLAHLSTALSGYRLCLLLSVSREASAQGSRASLGRMEVSAFLSPALPLCAHCVLLSLSDGGAASCGVEILRSQVLVK